MEESQPRTIFCDVKATGNTRRDARSTGPGCSLRTEVDACKSKFVSTSEYLKRFIFTPRSQVRSTSVDDIYQLAIEKTGTSKKTPV